MRGLLETCSKMEQLLGLLCALVKYRTVAQSPAVREIDTFIRTMVGG